MCVCSIVQCEIDFEVGGIVEVRIVLGVFGLDVCDAIDKCFVDICPAMLAEPFQRLVDLQLTTFAEIV